MAGGELRRPVTRLSTITGLTPASTQAEAIVLPMKPAPPAMSTFMLAPVRLPRPECHEQSIDYSGHIVYPGRLQRRAARADVPPELTQATGDDGDPGAELGDRLFALVAAARADGLDPETELRAAARRYTERVRGWEQAQAGGR